MSAAALVSAMVTAHAAPAPAGPYAVGSKTVTVPGMDVTNRNVDVVYPIAGANGPSVFPLVAYAHGFSDHGYSSYRTLFNELASWGFLVVAPQACRYGCVDDCKDGRLDPPCFGHYYKQQLKAIEWARSPAAGLPVNVSLGAAVAGHSMGGQSALFSAAYNSSSHHIVTSVMHHAFTHTFPAVSVPFLTFTGTDDTTAPPEMAKNIFNSPGACPTRGIINKVGANHHEPSTDYNPQLGQYTVAWLKVHLEGLRAGLGVDFYNQIYGNTTDSVCGGGDGKMQQCTMLLG